MALVVEDGTGLSTAEAYASVAELDTYVADFGLTLATSTTTEKEIALRLAARDMDAEYKLRWKGSKVNTTQALDWARSAVVDSNGRYLDESPLPVNLKRANMELAIRSRAGTVITPDVTTPGITREKVKAGEVERDVAYASPKITATDFTIVDNLLRELIIPSGFMDRG